MTGQLRDLIYFDFNKAASFFSQIERGLLKEVKETAENSTGNKVSGGINVQILRAELGGDASEKSSIIESRIMHHDLLTRLEDWLQDQNQLTDLNLFRGELNFSDESIRAMLKKPTFLTAEGWVEFHDYEQLSDFTSNYTPLVAFINQCVASELKKSEVYKLVEDQIQTLRARRSSTKVPEQRRQLDEQIKEREKALRELAAAGAIEIPEAWLLSGIRQFWQTLMPNRLELRIYPFEQNPRFSVVANLKRDCFLDTDLANAMFAYGRRPDLPLTVFGLTTAIPPATGHPFTPKEEQITSTGPEGQLEGSFRAIFKAFEGIESFVRYATYPRIVIYPIAIYQRLGTLLPSDEGIDLDIPLGEEKK